MDNADLWNINSQGDRIFISGQSAWEQASLAAQHCQQFSPDDEEEWVAVEEVSCYNCIYRRWTVTSFACCSPPIFPG